MCPDSELLSALALQAASALENANLYGQVRFHLERLSRELGVERGGALLEQRGLYVTHQGGDRTKPVTGQALYVWTPFSGLTPQGGDQAANERLFGQPAEVFEDGEIDGVRAPLFVNTLFSCLATTSETHSFKPLWKPPFISRLAPEDRCHLNGMAMRDGKPAYVIGAKNFSEQLILEELMAQRSALQPKFRREVK